MKLRLGLLALLLAAALPLAVVAQGKYEPPHQKPGPAAERLLFQAVHVDVAAATLRRGDIDFYAYSLKKEAAAALQGVPRVKVYEAPATSLSLVVNPAPAPPGELNPFSIKEVRFALQFLVNRAYIVQDIFRGLAQPQTTYVSPSDYDYLTVADLVRQYGITYEPERGRQMMAKALQEAGAVLKEGRWYYGDRPIQVSFIIRVEDERRDIGDLVRVELEKAGLTVNTIYQQFAPAILTVYGTDPQLLQWHLYTEGWGKGGAERYDYATANQMAAPWLGNLPGWQEVGFWQYQNPRLDELGQRLFRGDFAAAQERNDLYRQIAQMSLDESVRVWLATVVNTFPVREDVRGITEDVVAGPKALWTLREAYIPGKDSLTIGNAWVWTERTTWNPVGGFGDVYSQDIWRNVSDPPLATHPFTGLPIPFRANFQVETSASGLPVPEDALLWDVKAKAFRPVAAGTRAASKVIFDYSRYLDKPWHDGQPITAADILYSLYQSFDLAYDEGKARIEPALALTSRPYLDTFRGFRLDGARLEVYVNNRHFEPAYIAAYANLVGLSMPWEILAAMDRLVFEERRAAYSDTAAQRLGVSWLNLVMPRDALLVRRALAGFQERAWVPESVFRLGDKTFITREEALARYAAAIQWIDRYNLAVISNGPYRLVRFDPAAQFAELEAFRDPAYPFKPGDWYYGSIPRVTVVEARAQPLEQGKAGEVLVRLEGPEPLALTYSLYDAQKLILSGEGEKGEAGSFRITLTGEQSARLLPRVYRLFVLASSGELATPTEGRLSLEIYPPGQRPTPVPATATSAAPGGVPWGLMGAALALVTLVVAVTVFLLLRRRSA